MRITLSTIHNFESSTVKLIKGVPTQVTGLMDLIHEYQGDTQRRLANLASTQTLLDNRLKKVERAGGKSPGKMQGSRSRPPSAGASPRSSSNRAAEEEEGLPEPDLILPDGQIVEIGTHEARDGFNTRHFGAGAVTLRREVAALKENVEKLTAQFSEDATTLITTIPGTGHGGARAQPILGRVINLEHMLGEVQSRNQDSFDQFRRFQEHLAYLENGLSGLDGKITQMLREEQSRNQDSFDRHFSSLQDRLAELDNGLDGRIMQMLKREELRLARQVAKNLQASKAPVAGLEALEGKLNEQAAQIQNLIQARGSAQNAGDSAAQAAQHKDAAGDSAEQAGRSATAASQSEQAAQDSAAQAVKHNAAAKDSAEEAGQYKDEARTSAAQAGDSAAQAGRSAQAAGQSAKAAGDSAAQAGQSAKAAGDSAAQAGRSAQAADRSEQAAKASAAQVGEAVEVAQGHAAQADQHKDAAGASAAQAGQSAKAADRSAQAAQRHAAQAGGSAQNAGDSAAQAGRSAQAAGRSAQAARVAEAAANRAADRSNEEATKARNAANDSQGYMTQARNYANAAHDSLVRTITTAEGVATAHEAIIRHMVSMFGGIPRHIKTVGDGAFLNLSGEHQLKLEPGLILRGHSTSGAGAVVFMSDNSRLDLPNVQIFDNEAATTGGAFDIRGDSNLSLRSSIKGGVTIAGNKAGGQYNSIHLTGNGRVDLNAINENASIKIYDSMTDDNSAVNTRLNIVGAGKTKIYATSHLNNTNVNVEGKLKLRNGAGLEAKTITTSPGSRFSTVSGNAKRSDVRVHDALRVGGTIAVEAFGDGSNDAIRANTVTLDPTSSLEIDLDSRRFDELDFRLVDSPVVNGRFGSVNVVGGVRGKLMIFTPNAITAKLYGIGRQTSMASMSGLTKNQKSVATALDNMSSYSQRGEDIDFVIDRIDHLAAVDAEATQKALAQTSGYFLASVIRDATNNNRDVIYSRLNTRIVDNKGDVWGEIKGDFTEYSGDANSLGDHKDTETGATIGYDRYLTKGRFANKLLLGAYSKVNKHYVSQSSSNDGEITNAGLGLVGLYNEDDWEARAIIDGSYDLYTTKRQVQFDRIDRTAKANFSGMGLGIDLEGALKRDVGNQYILRPYVGLEARINSYGDIQEKEASDLSLTVDGDSYNRLIARAGLGIKKNEKKYTWNANIEYKHLLTDTVPTIVTRFGNTNEKFESLGSEEGRSIIGVGAGTSYKVSDSVTIFANANTNIAEKFKNVQSNVGTSYKFGMPKKENRKLTKEEKEAIKIKKQVNNLIYKKFSNKLRTYVKI
jgi:uncharacterized protein with beta-barrel porin domain